MTTVQVICFTIRACFVLYLHAEYSDEAQEDPASIWQFTFPFYLFLEVLPLALMDLALHRLSGRGKNRISANLPHTVEENGEGEGATTTTQILAEDV